MNPKDDEIDEANKPNVEDAMAVYGDTDMDPNRDDQRDMHHGQDETVEEKD